MAQLIKVKGLKGKQNKKKWRKNIDMTEFYQQMQKQNNEQLRQKYATPLLVESEADNFRKPLDPNRFKTRGVPLPKPKYDNKLKKQSIFSETIEDPWGKNNEQIKSKYKIPEVPAVIKPSTGHSYNPDQKGIQEVIDTVIDYEGQKQKKTKPIKKKQFKEQEIRHRNKNVRAQQLQLRQKKANKQFMHQLDSHVKISKEIEQKIEQIQTRIQQKDAKQQKLQKEAATGKVRYGKKLGKKQYKYREELPNMQETGKKLSHVSTNDSLLKDRFDSIYRRGIFEPRNIKVHANRTKKIKTTTRLSVGEQ